LIHLHLPDDVEWLCNIQGIAFPLPSSTFLASLLTIEGRRHIKEEREKGKIKGIKLNPSPFAEVYIQNIC